MLGPADYALVPVLGHPVQVGRQVPDPVAGLGLGDPRGDQTPRFDLGEQLGGFVLCFEEPDRPSGVIFGDRGHARTVPFGERTVSEWWGDAGGVVSSL